MALLAAAAAATLLIYRETLGYGFDYDDYHFVRPHSRSDVLAAFHGPWDATGIEVPFYRPLTVAFFAARFELFGLNSYWYHGVSLALVAAAAALAGWLAWRVSTRFAGGLLATLLLTAHPGVPYSLAAWITNQMHGIEIVVVLCALAWWHAVRRRPIVWWIPLLALGTAAFLIKEDGIMLLPAVAVIHTSVRWIDRNDAPRLPLVFLGLSFLLLAGLFLARREFLHGLGGYHHPTAAAAWTNLTKGLIGVFSLRPPDRPWQGLASWMAMLVPLVALGLWHETSRGTRHLFATGVGIALMFDLPFLFVSKAEQMHLVALGAVLALTAATLAIGEAFPSRGGGVLAAGVAAITIAAFAAVTRDISRDFEPYGPIVKAHDDLVKEWAVVPAELREYLKRKVSGSARESANPAEALPVVAFNLHGWETSPAGVPYRWMSSKRAELEIAASAREVTIPLRHEIGAFREPAHLMIRSDGRLVDDLTLRDGAWHMSRFAMRTADVSPLRAMHRVELLLDRVWRPQILIPGSLDTRTLGVQVGELQLR